MDRQPIALVVLDPVDVLPGAETRPALGDCCRRSFRTTSSCPPRWGRARRRLPARRTPCRPRARTSSVAWATRADSACCSLSSTSSGASGAISMFMSRAKQLFAQSRVAAELRGGTLVDHAPEIEHVDAIGDRRARAPHSARRSARRCASRFNRSIVAMTSPTILGARPWLGSSNSTRPGRAEQRPRDRDHLHFATRQILRLAVHQVLERARISRTSP